MPPASPQSPPTVSVLRSLASLLPFLRRRPGWVAASLGLLLINIAIELSLPQILGNAITRLGDVANSEPFSLREAVVLFLSLVVLRTLIGMILGPVRNATVQRTLGDVRAAVYDALQRQTFGWHDNVRTGELISRASTDIGRLQEFFFVCLLFAVDVVAGLIGTVWLVFAASALLGWITLAAMVPTVFALGFFAVRLQPRWRKVHDRHSAMSTVIQENIAGVRVVKAFAREPAELAKFQAKKVAFLTELTSAVNYWAARVPFAQFIFGLSVPVVLWAGGRQVLAGTLPLGDLAKVVFYLLGLGNRIGVIGQITTIVQNAGASAQRVYEILHAPVELRNGHRTWPRGAHRAASIRFESVTFRYPRVPSLRLDNDDQETAATTPLPPKASRSLALDDVSFEVTPGQTVALVGPTASGKSTVLALIPRFYEPTSGRVLVDDCDLREFDLDQLRRGIGMVFQETFLFSASVAENLAFGRPDASREDIVKVAQAARADEFIRALPRGYDTIIGERGISLSGGQRQRLAIARALLGDPRIILLDDATSAVDPKTEREIREATLELCRGRTTLVVAQRAATVRRADLILVFTEGRLVERGTHDQLLARGGLYYSLFRTQLMEEAHGSETIH
ncbi:MAG TPA: ABC transporter ATP-binding protein [Verrucomicrobiota bacterium]|nr:ABC transporter ATP-binding protein [Verrucomicrobiales bacterium]HRI11885.1 ABC transporter ATP-binding protein [Verrucomicrobiota bacterium]